MTAVAAAKSARHRVHNGATRVIARRLDRGQLLALACSWNVEAVTSASCARGTRCTCKCGDDSDMKQVDALRASRRPGKRVGDAAQHGAELGGFAIIEVRQVPRRGRRACSMRWPATPAGLEAWSNIQRGDDHTRPP